MRLPLVHAYFLVDEGRSCGRQATCYFEAMQTQFDTDALIAQAASSALSAHKLARVSSRPGVDSDGLDAVRVTIVLSGHDDALTGDAALNAIVAIHQALQKAGDERFPYVDFTNEHELASDADLEPDSSV